MWQLFWYYRWIKFSKRHPRFDSCDNKRKGWWVRRDNMTSIMWDSVKKRQPFNLRWKLHMILWKGRWCSAKISEHHQQWRVHFFGGEAVVELEENCSQLNFLPIGPSDNGIASGTDLPNWWQWRRVCHYMHKKQQDKPLIRNNEHRLWELTVFRDHHYRRRSSQLRHHQRECIQIQTKVFLNQD